MLVTLLQKHLGPQNSVLVETLAQHIGDRSPLFRLLSPTDSQGLISVLAERMRTVLQQEHTEFQKAMDPLREDGAVGRFITRLRDELKKTESDQEQQLKVALAALDTTKELDGDIKKRAENIRRNAEAIEKEVDVGQSKLGRIVGDAQKTLAALNVQLTDYQAERGCPIQLTTALPGNSSQQTGEVDPGALTVSPA